MKEKSRFAQLIERLFVEWQAGQKRRTSLDEFSTFIGYSQTTVSLWMSDKRKPSEDATRHLYELFGPEVYDALDLPRPDPLLLRIQQQWETLSDDERTTIQTLLDQAATRKTAHHPATP